MGGQGPFRSWFFGQGALKSLFHICITEFTLLKLIDIGASGREGSVMGALIRITRYFGTFFAAVVMIIAMATAAIWVILQILPKPLADEVWHNSMLLVGVDTFDLNFRPAPSEEIQSASRDQIKITHWVLSCEKAASIKFLDYNAQVLLTTGDIDFSADAKDRITINGVENRVAQLVHSIFSNRKYFDFTARDSYTTMTIAIMFTIFIGLCTTILVSLSSTDILTAGSKAARNVKLLAIVFPAVGTATAAVIAFYSPSDKYFRARQTLAALGQMHRQIANEVAKSDCVRDSNDNAAKLLRVKLDSWEDQYSNLLNALATKESSGQEATKQQGPTTNK